MKSSVELFVRAVQAYKEREAAKAIDKLAQGLSNFFVKDAPAWSSNEQIYTDVARKIAENLVDENATDNSAVRRWRSTLLACRRRRPRETRTSGWHWRRRSRFKRAKEALDKAYAKATDAMTKSLAEMSKRIHLVAEDKPMAIRATPVSVDDVENWAAQATAQ